MRARLLMPLLAVLAAAPAAGQRGRPMQRGPQGRTAEPQQPQAQLKTDPGRIEGKVLNAITGEPLRKAVVILTRSDARDARPRAVTSSPEGAFAFKDVEPGRYSLRAQRVGFLMAHGLGGRAQTGSQLALTVSPGQQITGVELKLTPQGVITGRVLDPDGDPVQNAQVVVSPVGSASPPQSVETAMTNDLGEYRIANLPAGRYYVMASGHGWGLMENGDGSPMENDLVATYYPSSIDIAGAAPVDVSPGQEVAGVQIALQASPVFRVRGKLSALPPGVGPQAVRVMIFPTERRARGFGFNPSNSAPVRSDGSFVLPRVVPGSYVISAMRVDGRPRTLGKAQVTVAGGNVDGVLVPVGDPVTLTGIVKTATGAQIDLSGTRIALQPGDRLFFGGADARVESDGSFRIEGVPRDRYHVVLFPIPENTYLKSVKMGSQETIDTGLDLSAAANAAAIEIVLGMNPGAVEGVVKEGDKPAAGRSVTIAPDPPKPGILSQYRAVTTDQNGAFRIAGLAPGNYRLYAWEEVAFETYTDPDVLKRFEDKSAKVSIREGAVERAELVLIKQESQ